MCQFLFFMLPLRKQHIVPCLQTGDYSRRGQQGASNHWATKVAGARQRVKGERKCQGATGVEPVTSRSAVECSATELYPRRLIAWAKRTTISVRPRHHDTPHEGHGNCDLVWHNFGVLITVSWKITADHDETRTRNLLIRSQTPYPLGHAV